ncbi:CTP:molybdopterin cytidylyltransferase [Pseudomonas chlororaphis subsp. aurantiaca]|nr:CTP:molybdopterin cytidylyltransferase [Pseudomonas chlororaphis subsp. aurantiaca]
MFAAGQVVEVELADAGVLWDVDVPQALVLPVEIAVPAFAADMLSEESQA